MNDGPKKTAQQIISEIAAKRKANEATKPALSIQVEAAKLKGEPEQPGDLSSKPSPASATIETVTAGNSALIGRRVRLFTNFSKLRDVAEITPLSSIQLYDSAGSVPPFWIQHKASGAREQCNGVSRTGGSFKFVSDEGLLITVSGGDHVMEATIGEPASSIFPVFASPEPMPIAAYAENAKKILCLGKTPLSPEHHQDLFLDLGNNFFLSQGACGFDVEGGTLTNAGQAYSMYYVNPDRLDRGRYGRKFSEEYHHSLCKPTDDVPYMREFKLKVGQQRQFVLGDYTVTISLSLVGNDMLSTDVKFY